MRFQVKRLLTEVPVAAVAVPDKPLSVVVQNVDAEEPNGSVVTGSNPWTRNDGCWSLFAFSVLSEF